MPTARQTRDRSASPVGVNSPPKESGSSEAELLSQLAAAKRVVAFVCSRRRLSADEAEEFSARVTLKLLEDDRAILRKFGGRSSIGTYLSVVIERLYLDYRVANWGKWRPSAEALRQGDIGVLLERLLGRDGLTADEAFACLTINHRIRISRPEFEALTAGLPIRSRRRFEGEDALASTPHPAPDPERVLLERDRGQSVERVTSELKRAIGGLEARDQLLLTLRYEDGRRVSEIAAILGEDQKRLYRRFESLLRQVRGLMESAGVAAGDVSRLLDTVALEAETDTELPSGVRLPTKERERGAE